MENNLFASIVTCNQLFENGKIEKKDKGKYMSQKKRKEEKKSTEGEEKV
jgi:hypothetical protein